MNQPGLFGERAIFNPSLVERQLNSIERIFIESWKTSGDWKENLLVWQAAHDGCTEILKAMDHSFRDEPLETCVAVVRLTTRIQRFLAEIHWHAQRGAGIALSELKHMGLSEQAIQEIITMPKEMLDALIAERIAEPGAPQCP